MPAGKTLLVTGASRGIGASVARLGARRGYRVCINYRSNHSAARRIVDSICKVGGEAICIAADISVESDVSDLFRQTVEKLGYIDALVCNAAMLEPQATLANIDTARLKRMLKTNLIGTILCCKAANEAMARSQGGRGGAIVNVSSVAARLGSAFEYVDYASSKAAVDTLTRGMAREVATDGIRVNTVQPGFIDTEMHAAGGEPDRVARLAPLIPLRRGGEAIEVARVILWLLSDAASYVTGAGIEVAGGI